MTHRTVVFDEKYIFIPVYQTVLLKTLEWGSDRNCVSASCTIILRIAGNKAIEYLLEEGIIENQEDLDSVISQLYDPSVRINEKSYPEFNENKQSQKNFKINIHDVGYINNYRVEFCDLMIKYSNKTLSVYPYDDIFITLRFDLINFTFNGYTFVFNMHNARPCDFLSDSADYKKNFNPEFPRKNWNEFNLFATRNTAENGTGDIEKLDKYEMYNNCEGYWYSLIPEVKTASTASAARGKIVFYPKIEYTILLYRSPYYVIKNAILPIILLMYLSSGCNFFGQEDTQYTNLLVLYLSFSVFLMNASGDLPQVSANNIVDMVIYFGYVLSFVQYLCLMIGNFKYWDGMFNSSMDITGASQNYNGIEYGVPTFHKDSSGNDTPYVNFYTYKLNFSFLNFIKLFSFYVAILIASSLTVYIMIKTYNFYLKSLKNTTFQRCKKDGPPFCEDDWIFETREMDEKCYQSFAPSTKIFTNREKKIKNFFEKKRKN